MPVRQVTDVPDIPRTGDYALAMGRALDGEYGVNAVDLHLDLSDQEDVTLKFWLRSEDDETDADDAIYLSSDGGAGFKESFALELGSRASRTYEVVVLNIDSLAQAQDLKLTDRFVVRFQQRGWASFIGANGYYRDGFFIDDVSVIGDATTPTGGPDTQAPAAPAALAAEPGGDDVTLTWTANAEADLQEYRIYRGTSPAPTDQIATIAAGTQTYTDEDLAVGQTYYYRLAAVDQAGNESAFSNEVSFVPTAIALGGEVPGAFALDQNYPNPFNPSTTITYALKQPEHVRLDVYDALGRHLVTLVEAAQAAGSYAVPADLRGLPSGAYFYRLQAGTFTQTRQMVLLE